MRTQVTPRFDELLKLLRSPHSSERESAVRRLGNSYCNDPSVAEPLVEALDDPDPGVRRAAAHSLGTVTRIAGVTRAAGQAVERLVALLGEENEEVIASAIYALGQLGDSSIGPKLLHFLDYPDRPNVKICRVAIEALRDLGYRPAIPHLSQLLYDSRPGVPITALDALFSMRNISSDIEEALRSVAGDSDSPLRERARMMVEIIAEEKQSE
jgi:HEAT repeat protein